MNDSKLNIEKTSNVIETETEQPSLDATCYLTLSTSLDSIYDNYFDDYSKNSIQPFQDDSSLQISCNKKRKRKESISEIPSKKNWKKYGIENNEVTNITNSVGLLDLPIHIFCHIFGFLSPLPTYYVLQRVSRKMRNQLRSKWIRRDVQVLSFASSPNLSITKILEICSFYSQDNNGTNRLQILNLTQSRQLFCDRTLDSILSTFSGGIKTLFLCFIDCTISLSSLLLKIGTHIEELHITGSSFPNIFNMKTNESAVEHDLQVSVLQSSWKLKKIVYDKELLDLPIHLKSRFTIIYQPMIITQSQVEYLNTIEFNPYFAYTIPENRTQTWFEFAVEFMGEPDFSTLLNMKSFRYSQSDENLFHLHFLFPPVSFAEKSKFFKLLESGFPLRFLISTNPIANAFHLFSSFVHDLSPVYENFLTNKTLKEILNNCGCGDSFLSLAVKLRQSPKICEKLIDLGASINYRDSNGNTLLHLASIIGRTELFKMFSHYIDIDILNNSKQTPLFLACQYGQYDTVVSALKKGANFYSMDSQRKSSLKKLFQNAPKEVVSLIEKYGYCEDDGFS